MGVRPRLLAVLALAGLSALVVAGSIGARTPSVPGPIPLEAFGPVVPGNSIPALARARAADRLQQNPGRAGDLPNGRALRDGTDIELMLRSMADRDLGWVAAPVPVASATTRPAKSATARHMWPLPIRGTITTRYSAAHRGVDIAVRAGTPVRTIARGTVIWAGWKTTGGGYVVEIRHPDGMISRYNHNRALLVRRGQIVSAGEQIAEVGSTGWSTGPHLDLRIIVGGVLINPLRLAWSR